MVQGSTCASVPRARARRHQAFAACPLPAAAQRPARTSPSVCNGSMVWLCCNAHFSQVLLCISKKQRVCVPPLMDAAPTPASTCPLGASPRRSRSSPPWAHPWWLPSSRRQDQEWLLNLLLQGGLQGSRLPRCVPHQLPHPPPPPPSHACREGCRAAGCPDAYLTSCPPPPPPLPCLQELQVSVQGGIGGTTWELSPFLDLHVADAAGFVRYTLIKARACCAVLCCAVLCRTTSWPGPSCPAHNPADNRRRAPHLPAPLHRHNLPPPAPLCCARCPTAAKPCSSASTRSTRRKA